MFLFVRDGRSHFSLTFSKQVATIGIINVPTTCNHNIKSHGINVHNLLHYFNFLIRKFSTHKYFKFEQTSKLVVKVGCETLAFYYLIVDFSQPFNNYNIRSMNHKDGSIISYQLLFTKLKASNVFY